MTIPPRQSSLWNNNARLARSRSDSKKTRHRCCLTRIGRQNKAFAYLNSSGAVNKKILKILKKENLKKKVRDYSPPRR